MKEVAIPGSGHDTEKFKVFAAFVGWESLEKYQAYLQTQAFKDSTHVLRMRRM